MSYRLFVCLFVCLFVRLFVYLFVFRAALALPLRNLEHLEEKIEINKNGANFN